MKEEERQACQALIIHTDGARRVSKEAFARQHPDLLKNERLSSQVLREACISKNDLDLSCALLIGFTFGFCVEQLDILSDLVDAEWHKNHEDVVSALDALRTEDAIPALYRASQFVPKYLEFDESRALASKAIWAIGRLPGRMPEKMLKNMSISKDPIVRDAALNQLRLRQDAKR